MNAEIKTKWLKALRSGEFSQGTGRLCSVDKDDQILGMCCLGVLCHITNTDHIRSFGQRLYELDRDSNYLPKLVQHSTDLEANPGIPFTPALRDRLSKFREKNDILCFDMESNQVKLAVLNDAGWTFAEIADLVEEHL